MAAPGGQPGSAFAVSAVSGLRLREGPNATARIVTTLPYGARVILREYREPAVTIGGQSARWAQVTAFGHSGWVFGGYLSEVDAFVKTCPDVVARIRALTGVAVPALTFKAREEAAKPGLTNVKAFKSNERFSAYSISLSGDCAGYGQSTCISVVGTAKGDYLFSDIEGASVGQLVHLDPDLAAFAIEQGEGDSCSGHNQTRSTIFEFASKRVTNVERTLSAECPSKHTVVKDGGCRCAVELRKSRATTITDAHGRAVRPSPAVERYLKK